MQDLPDDPADRRAALESWATEQRANKRSWSARARAWLNWRLTLGRVRMRTVSARLENRVYARGLDTEDPVHKPEHDHPDRRIYAPSAWRALPRALRYLGVSDQDTFVDFGCGKGRVVHQAAKRPFRRVIGVEISPDLAEIARTNLVARRHQHRCRNVEIVVADAREFQIPDDLTIGFFCNPFTGTTLNTVLRRIVDSIDRQPRRIRLIYLGPHGAEVLATGRFRLLKVQQGRVLDARAYRAEIFESY